MTSSNEVFVLWIRCGDSAEFDLRDILNVIGVDVVGGLTWGISRLDCTGPEAQDFCNAVNTARGLRLLVSGEQLLDLSQKFVQTIEGTLVGYSSEEDAYEFLNPEWTLTRFATSRAEIAIEVVDGCWFDVYLRSPTYVERLEQHFKDVRREDLAHYLEPWIFEKDKTDSWD